MSEKSSCITIQTELSAHLGGELPLTLQNHLDTCAECNKFYADLTILKKEVKGPYMSPSQALVMAQQAIRPNRVNRSPWFVPLFSASMSATLVILYLGITMVPGGAKTNVPVKHASLQQRTSITTSGTLRLPTSWSRYNGYLLHTTKEEKIK